MESADGNLIIVYNGEIYNYLSLRNELEHLGSSFQSKSDTEVILESFRVWGPSAFVKFEGIFAFALLDKVQNQLYLVRDPVGVKPLYYFLDRNELLFASEVRAFTSLNRNWEQNRNWTIHFLAFGSIPFPFTTLEKVVQLKPGSYLKLNISDFTWVKIQYHSFAEASGTETSRVQAFNDVRAALEQAISKNLLADVPVGIFVSGGVDSSLLAMLADRMIDNVRTLSVNFDQQRFDEHDYQHAVLENTQNTEHISHRVSEHMFWQQLPDIWRGMDQPSIDAINSFFIARCAKLEGIKVTLSGLGADEIFGGYKSFQRVKWLSWIRRIPNLKFWAKLAGAYKKSHGRLSDLKMSWPVGDYLFLRGIFTPTEIAEHLGISENEVWAALRQIAVEAPKGLTCEEYASFLENTFYLPNQLLKDADYMGMWHGIEIRVPYLDVKLMKKVFSISSIVRFDNSCPKYLLTASHLKLLPAKILFRKKMGFTFPFEVWLKNHGEAFRAMMSKAMPAQLVFGNFMKGREHWSRPWSLAVMEQFGGKIQTKKSNWKLPDAA